MALSEFGARFRLPAFTQENQTLPFLQRPELQPDGKGFLVTSTIGEPELTEDLSATYLGPSNKKVGFSDFVVFRTERPAEVETFTGKDRCGRDPKRMMHDVRIKIRIIEGNRHYEARNYVDYVQLISVPKVRKPRFYRRLISQLRPTSSLAARTSQSTRQPR